MLSCYKNPPVDAGAWSLSFSPEADLIEQVYEAAIDPDNWNNVLERASNLLGASAANLTFQDQVTGKGRVIVHGTDPKMFDDYFGYFATRNPLLQIKDFPLGLRILTDEDKLPKRDLVRGEYYNDFLLPMGAHSVLMIRLAIEGRKTTVMNIVRPPNREAFCGADLERIRRLHPHLIRSFRLASKLSNMERLQSGLETFLERSATAAFVVDTKGRVRHSNSAGEALLASRSGLTLVDGVLCALDGAASRSLHDLILAAGDRDKEFRRGGTMSLSIPQVTLPLSITVVPARSPRVSLFQADPCVLVCAMDCRPRVANLDEGVLDLLGLSRAEGHVATQLLQGNNAKQAAKNLSLSYNTVRAHLVRIMNKTGTHRQAELVSLMMRSTGA